MFGWRPALQKCIWEEEPWSRRRFLESSAALGADLASGGWSARAANAPGVTDAEIKIGQTTPTAGRCPR